MIPPKLEGRPDRVPFWRYVRLFRQDILSARPTRLYRAWMADYRTPFFISFLCNDPALVGEVLTARPDDFSKSDRVGEGLRPLLGQSVFVTNGETWKRQRRIIDPAFEGGCLRDTFPAMLSAVLLSLNITPGLLLFALHSEVVWEMIAALFIADVMLIAMNLPLVEIFARVLLIPTRFLMPLVAMIFLVGMYGIKGSTFDHYEMVAFGVLGWDLRKFEVPLVPVIVGCCSAIRWRRTCDAR